MPREKKWGITTASDILTLYHHLLWAKQWAWYSICKALPTKWALMLFPFYGWGNWGSLREAQVICSKLPVLKMTKLDFELSRAKPRTMVCKHFSMARWLEFKQVHLLLLAVLSWAYRKCLISVYFLLNFLKYLLLKVLYMSPSTPH